MTRYWYYYYDYYYERICLLAQHAESSTDHLGLSRACLDLDYRHAKTGSQSPLGQRCLTHPIHRCRGHVALLSIEKQKPHSDVFILKVPKSFFIPEKKWFFKEEEKKKKKTLILSPILIHQSFHCDSVCFVRKNQLCSDPRRSWLMSFLKKYVYLELITCMYFL